MKRVYAIIPAFNEQTTIEEVITRTKKINVVPVVVDDGSSDRTYELARWAGAVVLKHNTNKGKGEALKTGFNYINKCRDAEFIIILDADLQYYPEETEKLLEPLKKGEADFVTGYRNFKKIPFRHVLGNFVWRTCFNLLFGTNFRDTNCGLVALTKRAMSIMKRIGGGYIIENVMLVDALKNGLRIKQVPVVVHYRRKSEVVRGIRVVLGVLIFIIREGVKYRLS